MATPSGSFCPLAASVSRCVEGSPDEECCLDWDCPSKIHLTLSNIHLTHAHTHISKDAKALDENQLYNIFSGLSLTCQKIRKIRFPIKEPHPNLYLKSPCSGPPATRATPGPPQAQALQSGVRDLGRLAHPLQFPVLNVQRMAPGNVLRQLQWQVASTRGEKKVLRGEMKSGWRV